MELDSICACLCLCVYACVFALTDEVRGLKGIRPSLALERLSEQPSHSTAEMFSVMSSLMSVFALKIMAGTFV